MIEFTGLAAVVFAFYLVLTMWTGSFGLWSLEELIIGAVLALIVALIARSVFVEAAGLTLFNPLKWLLFLIYLVGPFFYAMAKANLDVAYRVITGRINPGIVKLKPNLKSHLGSTMLANSITLTPGTLTVDVSEDEKDLYVHWINVTDTSPSPEQVCGHFPKWARRVTE